MCVCEYSLCVDIIKGREGGNIKETVSAPRQGFQLTKAAQHASVCMAEKAPLKLQVCLYVGHDFANALDTTAS